MFDLSLFIYDFSWFGGKSESACPPSVLHSLWRGTNNNKYKQITTLSNQAESDFERVEVSPKLEGQKDSNQPHHRMAKNNVES